MSIEKLIFFSLCLLTYSNIAEAQSSKYKELNWNIDPDSYSFSIDQIENKWNSKIGGEFFLPIIDNNKLEIKTSIGAFINIKNFSKNLAFSWQIWRGNIGASLFLNLINQNWLPNNSRLAFQFTYAHESQHATDIKNYTLNYLDPNNLYFDNAGIRSFEFIKLSTEYKQQLFNKNLVIPIKIGYKYFPKPSLSHTKKMLDYAIFLELGLQWKLKKYIFLYTNIYIENISNSYNYEKWGYLKDLAGEDLKYRLIEMGIVFKNKKEQTLGVYFYITNSNGRGLDFVDNINSFGVGTRFFL